MRNWRAWCIQVSRDSKLGHAMRTFQGLILACFVLAGPFCAPIQAQQPAKVVLRVGLDAVECIVPIGAAPEMRQAEAVLAKADPGPIMFFAVKINETANRNVDSIVADPSPSEIPGFMQTDTFVFRLQLRGIEDGLKSFSGMDSTALPKDRMLLFFNLEQNYKLIAEMIPACEDVEARELEPFIRKYDGLRSDLRELFERFTNQNG